MEEREFEQLLERLMKQDLAAGTEEAVAAGFNAGKVIKAISPAIKGGGGGKPTMAQAGGKDASGLDDALQAARDLLL